MGMRTISSTIGHIDSYRGSVLSDLSTIGLTLNFKGLEWFEQLLNHWKCVSFSGHSL